MTIGQQAAKVLQRPKFKPTIVFVSCEIGLALAIILMAAIVIDRSPPAKDLLVIIMAGYMILLCWRVALGFAIDYVQEIRAVK